MYRLSKLLQVFTALEKSQSTQQRTQYTPQAKCCYSGVSWSCHRTGHQSHSWNLRCGSTDVRGGPRGIQCLCIPSALILIQILCPDSINFWSDGESRARDLGGSLAIEKLHDTHHTFPLLKHFTSSFTLLFVLPNLWSFYLYMNARFYPLLYSCRMILELQIILFCSSYWFFFKSRNLFHSL